MKFLLPAAVFLLMVSVGTSLRAGEMRDNARQMGWLGWMRLLVAVFVVPPTLALMLARLFSLTLPETGGLFLIGVAPGAPLLTRNVAKRGFDPQLAAMYQVGVAILTPVVLPLLVYGAGKLYDRNVWIPPRVLLAQVAEKEFAPFILGMLLMLVAPVLFTKLRPWINGVGNGLFFGFVFVILYGIREQLKQITPWVIVACLLLAAGSMAIVHLMLRVDSLRRHTLSICNANRHVGLALLLSGQYMRNRGALPTVACYAIVAPVLMAVYSRKFGTSAARQDVAQGASQAG